MSKTTVVVALVCGRSLEAFAVETATEPSSPVDLLNSYAAVNLHHPANVWSFDDNGGEGNCTATFIGRNVLLTAAHCIQNSVAFAGTADEELGNIWITLGGADLPIEHAELSPSQDLALLFASPSDIEAWTDIHGTNTARVACAPPSANDPLTLPGFGGGIGRFSTYAAMWDARSLQRVSEELFIDPTVDLVDDKILFRDFVGDGEYPWMDWAPTDPFFDLDPLQVPHDAAYGQAVQCGGDSGGGYIHLSGGEKILHGVVSASVYWVPALVDPNYVPSGTYQLWTAPSPVYANTYAAAQDCSYTSVPGGTTPAYCAYADLPADLPTGAEPDAFCRPVADGNPGADSTHNFYYPSAFYGCGTTEISWSTVPDASWLRGALFHDLGLRAPTSDWECPDIDDLCETEDDLRYGSWDSDEWCLPFGSSSYDHTAHNPTETRIIRIPGSNLKNDFAWVHASSRWLLDFTTLARDQARVPTGWSMVHGGVFDPNYLPRVTMGVIGHTLTLAPDASGVDLEVVPIDDWLDLCDVNSTQAPIASYSGSSTNALIYARPWRVVVSWDDLAAEGFNSTTDLWFRFEVGKDGNTPWSLGTTCPNLPAIQTPSNFFSVGQTVGTSFLGGSLEDVLFGYAGVLGGTGTEASWLSNNCASAASYYEEPWAAGSLSITFDSDVYDETEAVADPAACGW